MRIVKLIAVLGLLTLALAACDRPGSTQAPVAKPSQARVILVTGATGTQGGAVARELLRRGYSVRAMTRNPDGSRARVLAELGAEPVRGDFNDPESIAAAMAGVDGVFAVTLFWSAGYEGEIEQGRRLIEAAEQAGVEHFVLTSVAGADESTGIPHFDSKWVVEQSLHESDLNWTIVRPVEFMDNWRGSVALFREGRLMDPRSADSSHQWIAASDIGYFVGEAFDKPEEWMGVTREIAGDELTVSELSALLSEAFGREVVHVRMSWEDFESEAGEEVTLMYRWFENAGYSVDVAALRNRYPDLIAVRAFLDDLAARSAEADSSR